VSKYVLSIILLLMAATVFGQKKSIVTLIHSQSSTGIKLNGKDVIKVYQGTFKQDFSTLSSDSAYFYPQDNAFDAFGHVDINQGDTLHIYGDKLNYNGNTKIAILTDNVRMVDKDATLTTNHLTYNTATRIGVYTEGGKLVNKDNTLLSKNGYYFAFSRDSYFRYNVSLTTPDALIITDTMRYNTGTKISYFYGPTNIYSIKKEKDKDTLYTENGTYNTVNEQAAFGKNNLYRSGTRSLKGDSLFYDKLKGYGRAVKHVTFTDKEQKTTIKGDLGTYFKADERTVMTQDPYVVMVTEEKDTTKADSIARADSVAKANSGNKKLSSQKKKVMNMADEIKKTIPSKIDTSAARQKEVRLKADSAMKKLGVNQKDILQKADSALKKPGGIQKGISLKTDSTLKKLSAGHDKDINTITALAKNTGIDSKAKTLAKAADKDTATEKLKPIKDTSTMKHDSIYMSADTIETQILTYKDLKVYFEKQRLAHTRDTSAKPKSKKPKVNEISSKLLTAGYAKVVIAIDTSYHHSEFFGKPKPVKKKAPKPPSKKQLALDSIAKKQIADSIMMVKRLEPSDTARIRILIMHHHAKLFKSDLQGKADSMFYATSDSTVRCFVNPMIWSEGSQFSGDTIYLQMKHKKLDNMTMFPNAFIVNIEKDDSVHFNQVAGKRLKGYFKDNKLSRVVIDGNAESIYFSRDSGKTTISGISRSLSSHITVDFKDNKVIKLGLYTKPEDKYGPQDKFKDDDKILKGFIWKPKERPVSKESIIPSYNRKAMAAAAAKAPPDKSKLPDGKTVKDSTIKLPAKSPDLKTGKDSTVKSLIKPTALKNVKGSSINSTPPRMPFLTAMKDSTVKITPVKLSDIKFGSDSVKVKPVNNPPIKN